ncbi:hypothetical protein PIB30_020123 [Stylosanthes scabra]|uniref:Uncharacterized protein n=1 Tax=Stylosanthes scabra TaxID=79078 RepID=A0ABU6X820_9FABA|nr:hypothetical protein [Stylosanthes scabra]
MKGQADTIGIAMRRVLLGEIEGTCITRANEKSRQAARVNATEDEFAFRFMLRVYRDKNVNSFVVRVTPSEDGKPFSEDLYIKFPPDSTAKIDARRGPKATSQILDSRLPAEAERAPATVAVFYANTDKEPTE